MFLQDTFKCIIFIVNSTEVNSAQGLVHKVKIKQTKKTNKKKRRGKDLKVLFECMYLNTYFKIYL